MKRLGMILTAVLVTTAVLGQKVVFEADVFNGYDRMSTVISVNEDADGLYFFETRYRDNDELVGRICIGENRGDAVNTLKVLEYFVETPYMTEATINNVKTFKRNETAFWIEHGVECTYEYSLTYVTDTSGVCLEIPDEYIRQAKKHIK